MKKIKRYFELRKQILIEILETLCSICLYLEIDGRHHNKYSQYMGGHFINLKMFSEELRGKK